jgi:hypothetical protein
MTAQERDYEEILGRALHSATDQIEPVGDGLTKIRARLTEPWLKRQWWLLRSELMVLRWLVVVRLEAFLSTARAGAAAADLSAGSGTPSGAGTAPDAAASPDAASGRRPRSLRPMLGGITAWAAGKRPHKSPGPAMAWLRPALAVAGAVVLVVAGVFALGGIRETFVGLENDNSLGSTTTSHGSGPGNTNGSATLRGSTTPAHRGSRATSPGATTKHSRATAAPSACSSPSTPPVNSPSPSPTPTTPSPSPTPTSPSPSPTPTTPSPSPSISGGPLVSGLGGYHSQAPIRTTALMVCEPTPAPATSPTNQAGTGS